MWRFWFCALWEPQRWIRGLQARQKLWQQVGRNSRNDSELQRPRQDFAMAGEIDQVARCRKNPLGTLRDFDAGLRQSDVTWPPLYEVGADFTFQFLDLHRERRLGDAAFIGGALAVRGGGGGAE